jgi:hypothetical protein
MRRATSLLFAILLALAGTFAGAQEIRFSTENDIFGTGDSKDDLYTFAVRLEMQGEKLRYSIRENAFTDRAAGTRFDETQASIGRSLPPLAGWASYGEAGLVRVGRGIFGQETQNVVHGALGSDEVVLPYEEPSLHGRLALDAERPVEVADSLTVAPRVELEWIPGLRSHAVVAAQAVWRPAAWLTVAALAGARVSDADYAPLEPHTLPFAEVARLGFVAFERVFVSWSKNDHGDGRSHLSLGYRFTRLQLGGWGVRD